MTIERFLLDQHILCTCGGFKDECYKNYWGKYHYAADYEADFVPIYAWTRLNITREVFGCEGGNWLYCEDEDKNTFRLAHLSQYKVGLGWVNPGKVIAISGDSGMRKNAAGNIVHYKPHLHIEWRKPDGTLGDPEEYFNQNTTMPNYASRFEGQTIITSEEGSEKGKWYWVRDGKKHLIPDKMTGWSYGLLAADVNFIAAAAIRAIPTGEQLKYWDGSYFRFVEDIYNHKSNLKK